ncbi:MAG TPA: LptF/LptG family permease [Planctomycetaceae bacterium]|nr:LptF/LptG family permease [Planctomycetaceae bacterium]
MRLLQRYILAELLRVFAFLLSVLTVLLVFVGVFREVSESGLGPFQILQILPFIVPSLLPFTIPATLLLTVCVVYGRIAGDHEITAAKAAGINVLSLLWPAFILGGVLSLCSLLLTDQVIPWAVGNIQKTVTLAMEDIFLDMLRTNHQVTDADRGFSVTVIGVDGKRLLKPTFQYAPRGRQPLTIQAQEATLEFDLDRQEVMLHLVRGRVHAPPGKEFWFDREDYPFPLPRDLRRPKPRHLSIRDIHRESNTLARAIQERREHRTVESVLALTTGSFEALFGGTSTAREFDVADSRSTLNKLKTELHSRFALGASCLCFALLGGPFAILKPRRQFLTSFALCFLPILILYYPVVLLMMNLSKSDSVNPAWAMWVGNVLLLAAAGVVLRRVLRH